MVKGVGRFRARMDAIPEKVRRAVEQQLDKEAGKVAAVMSALKPLPEIEINHYSGGAAEQGGLTTGGADQADLSVKITATARTEEYPEGFPAIARWFEFGTTERVQKTTGRRTGRIPAQPFFYPVWRSERARVRANINRAVRRAIRKS